LKAIDQSLFYTNQGLPINVEDYYNRWIRSFTFAMVARWIRDEIIIPEPFYANYNGFSAASELM
jgi:aspartate aminotransferase